MVAAFYKLPWRSLQQWDLLIRLSERYRNEFDKLLILLIFMATMFHCLLNQNITGSATKGWGGWVKGEEVTCFAAALFKIEDLHAAFLKNNRFLIIVITQNI